MINYYEVLDIQIDSSKNDIRKAYRKLAFKYHPDHNNSVNGVENFRLITEAYEILINDEKRNIYNQLFFSNDTSLDLKNKFRSWKHESSQNSERYCKQTYSDFQSIIDKEFKIIIKHSPYFGCLIFILFGFSTSIVFLFIEFSNNNENLIWGLLINIIFYGIAVYFLYPKFINNYKNERKNVFRKN